MMNSPPNCFLPETWVVASDAVDSARYLRDQLQTLAKNSQMLDWRLRHGVARVVDVAALHCAVKAALDSGSPAVHVRCLVSKDAARRALSQGFSAEQSRRLDLRACPAASAADLAVELGEPDSASLVHYLASGREQVDAVAPTGAGANCGTEYVAAFRQWADQALADADMDLLDEIFGAPATSAPPIEAAAAPAPDPKPARGTIDHVADFIGAIKLSLSELLAIPAALGAASASSTSFGCRVAWRLRHIGTTRASSIDQVQLLAPDRLSEPDEANGILVRVTLDSAKWTGRTALHLNLHPAGAFEPLRLYLGDATSPAEGTPLKFEARVGDVDETFVEAACKGTVELEFLPPVVSLGTV